ncbi:hypothetical protein SCHPADRAFT_118325 [Schizopora paradoxa]|uniref:Uncharacterized protein n=1 Tax=Schizopora paradoxa TaxID=27342 RepID=A0A0H2S3B8_9AGAM|nr:hypothetical protein SCHPADRAFT_118325 [Schizopora paradoxa]
MSASSQNPPMELVRLKITPPDDVRDGCSSSCSILRLRWIEDASSFHHPTRLQARHCSQASSSIHHPFSHRFRIRRASLELPLPLTLSSFALRPWGLRKDSRDFPASHIRTPELLTDLCELTAILPLSATMTAIDENLQYSSTSRARRQKRRYKRRDISTIGRTGLQSRSMAVS